MIIDALIALFRTVVNAVVNLLPTVTVDSYDLSAWSLPWGIIDPLFPRSHFLSAIGVLLGWTVICHGYRIVLWILGLLHIAGNAEG